MPKLELKNICLLALEENKAEDVLALDVKNISTFADSIIIASANSNRHAKSISEKVIESIKRNKETLIGMSHMATTRVEIGQNLQMALQPQEGLMISNG